MTTIEISIISVYYFFGVIAYFRSGIKEDIESGELKQFGWILCAPANFVIAVFWPILLLITWTQGK